MSVLAVLKSQLVDVEDFDRVVGAGAGELDPGALLLRPTVPVSLSILLSVHSAPPAVVLPTCSPGSGPPAEPLHRQSVALSDAGRLVKEERGCCCECLHRVSGPGVCFISS